MTTTFKVGDIVEVSNGFNELVYGPIVRFETINGHPHLVIHVENGSAPYDCVACRRRESVGSARRLLRPTNQP